MYHQIIHPHVKWDTMSIATFPQISFSELVTKLAKSELTSVKDLTIIFPSIFFVFLYPTPKQTSDV